MPTDAKPLEFTARAGVAAEAGHHVEELNAMVSPADARLEAGRPALARASSS